MPLKYENWSSLMDEVERISFKSKNQSKASYNVRNAYFLDDLTKLGGEDRSKEKDNNARENLEAGVPSYMHMLSHVVRSRNYTKPGQYVSYLV